MWDDEGNSTEMYRGGQKLIHAESVFTIKDNKFDEEFDVDAGDIRDVYNPVNLPRIEIVSRSRYGGIIGIYQRLCEVIENYDFEYASEESEVQVKVINRGKTYSYEFTK